MGTNTYAGNNPYQQLNNRRRSFYRRLRPIFDEMTNNPNFIGFNEELEESPQQWPNYFQEVSNEDFEKLVAQTVQGMPGNNTQSTMAAGPNSPNRVTSNRMDRKILRDLRMQHFPDARSEVLYENWSNEVIEMNSLRGRKQRNEKIPLLDWGAAKNNDETMKGIVLHLAPINPDLSFKEEPKEVDWVYYEEKKKPKEICDKPNEKGQKNKTVHVSFV